MATNEEFVIKVKAELAESSITNIQKKIRTLNTIKPTLQLNTSKVNKQLKDIQNQIKALSKIKINLGSGSKSRSGIVGGKGSISSILSDYKKLEREISSKQKLNVRVDGTSAVNTIAELNKQIDELNTKKAKIEAEFDGKLSKKQLSDLKEEAEKVQREIDVLNAKKLDMKNMSETSKVFKDMKQELNNISKIKVKMSGLDNTTKEFEVLQNQLKNAEKSLTSLMAMSGNKLSTEQWNELVRLSKQYSDNLNLVNAKNVDSKNLETYKKNMKELISLNQKMNGAEIKYTKATLDASSTVGQIERLKKEFESARDAYNKFLNEMVGGRNRVDTDTWNTIQSNVDETKSKIAELQEVAEKSKNKLFDNIGKGIDTHSFDKAISDVETKIKNLSNSGADVSKLKQSLEDLKKAYSQMQDASKSGNVDKATQHYQNFDRILKTLQNDIGITSNKFKDLGNSSRSIGFELANFAKYYFSIHQVFNAFKEGCSFVKEMDDALTNINYTMSVTKEQLQEVANKTIDMAKDLKTSTSNVMEAVTLYANSQQTTDSILKKSETAVKLSNVTGMTGEESAEMLQSIMNQFQLTEDDLEHISDTMQGASQTMAHDFADGIKEMAEGIEVSGSVAKSAGMSLEEYVALLGTSIEETGLQGSQIANAYRTIFLRTTKASKAFGTLEEDISASEGSLRAVGVAVRDSEGDFREIQDILGDLASVWNDLDEVSQNNIAYNMAGVRQTNILTSLLGRWEEYQRVLTETKNSDGVTDKNQEKYEEKIGANLNELSTAFDEFWYSVLDSDTMNAILGFLTKFLEAMTAITEATHGVGTALMAVFAIDAFFSIRNAVKDTKNWAEAFALLKKNGLGATGILSKLSSGVGGVFSKLGVKGLAIGATIGVAFKVISDACTQATRDFEEAKKAFDKSEENYNTEVSESNSLNSLIEQYERLAKVNNVDAEKREQIQNIQEQIVDLVGEQASGLDLVNGKLSTQKKELERIAYVKAQDKANSAKDEYNKAVEMEETAVGSYGREGKLGTDLFSDKDHDAYLETSFKSVMDFVMENDSFVDISFGKTGEYSLDFIGKNATEKVENGSKYLEKIENAINSSTSEAEKKELRELYDQVNNSISVYSGIKNDIETSSYDILDSTISTAKYETDEKYGNDIKSYEDYLKYRENFINTMKSDSNVVDLLDNGDVDNEQIESRVDGYLGTISELAKYHEKFQTENSNLEVSTDQSFDTIRDLFSVLENKDATISLSVDDGNAVQTIENVFSAVESASTDTTAQDTARQMLEDYARQMGVTIEQLKADMDTYDLGNTIQGLWDSEGFKETKNQLVALSNSTGITANDIESMASESQVLSGILNTTGMSAQYLANCFDEMSNGSSALDIISTDGLALNSVLSDMDNRLQSVNSSYNEYIHSIEGNDYDAQFNSYTEAYKSMQEMIKNNEFGKKYYATAEYLLGDKANTMSAEEIKKSVNGNLKTVFEDETTSGTKLLELLYAQKDAMKDLNSSVTQENGKWKFDFDLDELSELSKIVGLTEDETLSCINALGMFGDFKSFNTDNLVEKFKSLNSVLVTESGLAVSSKEHVLELLESIGYTGREANQVLESLEESKDIKIFDFEDTSKKGLKNTLKELEKLSGLDFMDKKNVNLSSFMQTLVSEFGLGTDRVKEFTSAMEKQGYVFTSSTGEIKDLDTAIDTLANNNATLVLNKDLEQAKVSAREAVDCLNGIEIKGVEDKIELDFDTTDLDTMQGQIELATKILDNFKKEDGTVDLSIEGANEAQIVLSTLLRQKQQISVPEIMQIDTSYAEGEAYDSVEKIQTLINAYMGYQIDLKVGFDTATSKANYEKALKEVQKDEYITTKVKLDTTNGESLINQVTSDDFNPIAKFGVDKEAVEEYKKKNNDIEPKVHYKLDDTSKQIQEFIQSQHTVDTTINFKVGTGQDVYDMAKGKTSSSSSSKSGGSKPSPTPSPKPSPTPSPKYNGTANAKGNWGVERNESSLVGELGQEIVVRDGKFFTVGDNGAEIVSLKKNDIVFNHQQTRQILENGKISFGSKRGKVVGASFAKGSAYESGTVPIDVKSGEEEKKKKKKKKTSEDNLKDNSKEDKSEDKKLDKFKKWLEKFVDWIEVRVTRLQSKIEKSIASAERFAEKNNYSKSAKSYKQAIKVTYNLIDVNEKGKQKYKAKADAIGNKAVKDGLISKKKMNEVEKKVKNGSLDISDYTEREREIISSYKEYYEKSLECAKATTELKNNIDEYAESLYNLPLEKASKKIEELSETLDTLSAKASAVSGGGSVYNKVVEENAKKRLNAKKTETKKADKQVEAKTKKVNSVTKKVNKAEKKVNTKAEKLAENKQLTKEQKQSVKKGQKIDTSNLKGNAKKQANTYNKAVENKKKAKKKLKNAKSEKADAQKKQTKAKNEQKEAQKDYNKVVSNVNKYANSKSYEQANDVLSEINTEKKKEVSYNNTAKQEADKNRQDIQKEKEKAKKKVETTSEKLLKNKNLSASQKKAVKNGKEINTKGLKGNALKQAQAYNKALEEQARANTKLAKAKEKQKEANNNLQKSEVEYTTTLRDNTKQMLDNIETSYDSEITKRDNNVAKTESDIELKKANGSDISRDDYSSIISDLQEKKRLQEEEKKAYEDTFKANEQNMSEDEIAEAEAKVLEMENNAKETENSILDAISKGIQAEVDTTQNIIDNLKAENELLSSAEAKNSNLKEQIDQQKKYYDLMIEQENNAVKKAELRAEKERTIRDLLKEQLDNIIEQSERFASNANSRINEDDARLEVSKASGRDNNYSRVSNYENDAKLQSEIANERFASASELNNKLWGEDKTDYGYWNEDKTVFYVNDMKAFDEGMTEYHNMMADAYKAEAQAIQDNYNIWQEKWLQPKLDSYEVLENKEAELEDELSMKQLKGIDLTSGDYSGLIQNSKEKVENLAEQNRLLEEQRSGYDKDSEKYKEIQKQIDDNNKSIRDAEKSQLEWNQEILNMPIEKLETIEDILSNITAKIKAVNELKETKGIKLTVSDYQKELNSLEKERRNKEKQLNEYENNALKARTSSDGAYNGHNADYWSNQAVLAETAMLGYEKSIEEVTQAMLNIPIDRLKEQLSYQDSINDKIKSEVELKKALKGELSREDYTKQIEQNNSAMLNHLKTMEEYKNNALNARKSSEGVYNGHDADYWFDLATQEETAINNVKVENEELKKSLRDDVYWRGFEKAKEALENIQDLLSGIGDLITDEMVLDDNGAFTDMGLLKISNNIEQFETAKDEVVEYSKAIEDLKRMKSQGLYDGDEQTYTDKMKELQDGLLSSAKTLQSTEQSIADIFKNQMQSELDSVFDLIDARSELLQKTKEYYDYSKNIKEKTKDVTSIKAKISALQGVETNEAKAELKQLTAQLSEAEDDMQDTVNEHIMDLSTEALDDLKDILQDELDDEIKKMSSSLESIDEYMEEANRIALASSRQTNSALSSLLKHYGMSLDDVGLEGYASGTKSVDKDKLAWTQEKGSEIIVRQRDGAILTGLAEGDSVIPNDLTENLYDWGVFNPRDFLNNIVGSTNVPTVSTPVNVVTKYENLLNVEGNVDEKVLPDLQTILEKSYEYTSKQQTRNLKLAGYKPKF